MRTSDSSAVYSCELPTEAATLASLVRLLGVDDGRAAWTDACARAGLRGPVASLVQLQRAAEQLTTSDDQLVRVAGRTLQIRLRAYNSLMAGDPVGSAGRAPMYGERNDRLTDAERLREIAELGLDRDVPRPELDMIAREAAQTLGLPIGVVSIVLDEAEWYVGTHGLDGWVEDAQGTPVEWSFCQHVIHTSDEFVVENALEHPVMKHSPLVQHDGLRCFAGIPLVSSRGHVVGSFCVKGTEERTFDTADLTLLREFAARAVDVIESGRAAVPARPALRPAPKAAPDASRFKNLAARCSVESLGTFFLVFTICSTALAGSAAAPFAIAAVLAAMIYAGGHISGAHFNPAVTLAATLRGAHPRTELLPYWLAQCVGAALAAAAARVIAVKGAGPALELTGSRLAAAGLAELLLTFALAFVVLNVATARANSGNPYFGAAIAATVLAGAIGVGGVSGGAFNPAVAVGVMTAGLVSWSMLPMFVVANLAGGALAALVFRFVSPGDFTAPAEVATVTDIEHVPAPHRPSREMSSR